MILRFFYINIAVLFCVVWQIVGEERPSLLEIILVDVHIRLIVSILVGLVADLVRGADVVLAALDDGLGGGGTVFIGEEEIEVDLGVVDWF